MSNVVISLVIIHWRLNDDKEGGYMNKKKELRGLLKASMENKEERYRSYSPYYGGGYRANVFQETWNDKCHIRFYEWSDITRQPLQFETITDFKGFLKHSNIAISDFQEQYLSALPDAFASCEKGTGRLLIKNRYDSLFYVMTDDIDD